MLLHVMRHENVTLRLAIPADAKQIAFMSRDLIESGLGWSWNPARVESALRHRETLTLVACDRGQPGEGERVVAFAIMQFGDEHAHLSLLAVRPTHWRTGLGRRMLEWLIESSYAAGVAAIHLELRAANQAARRFYRALGFTESAYIPGYYQGREMALRMLRELRKPGVTAAQWQLPAPPSNQS
jgi:ribosomal-protein-alanine N-acetyltransferase